jgi:hypothetical protein
MRSSPPGYRLLSVLVGLLAAATVAGAVLLWPGRAPAAPNAGQQDPTRLVDATLTKAVTVPCQADERLAGDAACKDLEAQRADNGQRVRLRGIDWTGDLLRPGRAVRLAVLEQPGQPASYALVHARGEGEPVLSTVADDGGPTPRVVLHVTAEGLERVRQALVRLGIDEPMLPRRSRAQARRH